MKNIQLSIYDTVGYVIPGFILIFGTPEILNIYHFFGNRTAFLSSISAMQWVTFLILSYFLGHCLHAISNLTFDKFLGYPSKYYFERKFAKSFDENTISKLVEKISSITGSKDIKDKTTFLKSSYWLCYTYVVNASSNALSPVFLSLTGFYRGLSISFGLLFVFSLARVLFFADFLKLIHLSICSVFLILFILRAFRFSDYLSNTVYSEFLILAKKD